MINLGDLFFAVLIILAICLCKKQHDAVRAQFPILLRLVEINVKQPIRMYIGNREIVATAIIANSVCRTLIFKNLQTEINLFIVVKNTIRFT